MRAALLHFCCPHAPAVSRQGLPPDQSSHQQIIRLRGRSSQTRNVCTSTCRFVLPRPGLLICQSTKLEESQIESSSAAQSSLLQVILDVLGRSNDALPYAVVASSALALLWPGSFGWFTPPLYAPAMGFLMFAVGVNLSIDSFVEVFNNPKAIAVGTLGQWGLKPWLSWLVACSLVPALHLPDPIGTGLILVGCVSGAQLSNYATFLAHPEQAPLSIVLTALSTACGVALTPLLALMLMGTRIPVDAAGMAVSIAQIVLVPVSAGLLCNRLAPRATERAKPLLSAGGLADTCACVGGSLAANAAAAKSLLGVKVLVPVCALHGVAFILGYQLARRTIAVDDVPLARCITLETGMQSSVLALLLASKFFEDPLVSLTCGISVIVMTLGGFGLVVWWKNVSQLSHKAQHAGK